MAGEIEKLELGARATAENRSCEGLALPNYYELEMDGAPAANRIMDTRFPTFFFGKRSRLVSKASADRILTKVANDVREIDRTLEDQWVSC